MKKYLLLTVILSLLCACTPDAVSVDEADSIEEIPQTNISVYNLVDNGILPAQLPAIASDTYYVPHGIYNCRESNDSVQYQMIERDSTFCFDPHEQDSWISVYDAVFHFRPNYVNVMDMTRLQDYSGLESWKDLAICSYRIGWKDSDEGSFILEYADEAINEKFAIKGKIVYCAEDGVVIDYYRSHQDMPQSSFTRVVYAPVEATETVLQAEARLDGSCLLSMIPYTNIQEEKLPVSITEEEFLKAVEGNCYSERYVLAYNQTSEGAMYYVANSYSYNWINNWLGVTCRTLQFTAEAVQPYFSIAPFGWQKDDLVCWSYDSCSNILMLPGYRFCEPISQFSDLPAKVRYVDDTYLILDINSTLDEGPDVSGYVVRLVLTRCQDIG